MACSISCSSLQEARAAPVRNRRGQSRPEAARIFPPTCCRVYLAGRGVPFHIEEQDTYSVVKRVIPDGAHDVLAVLAAAPRRSVPRGERAQAPPRSRSATTATTFWRPSSSIFFRRQAQDHAAEARLRRRQARRHPSARLRARARPRRAMPRRWRFRIIPCNLCGSQEHLQRKQVGAMLREWERKHPGRSRDRCSTRSSNVVTDAPARSHAAGFRRRSCAPAYRCRRATSHSTTRAWPFRPRSKYAASTAPNSGEEANGTT